MAVEVVAADSPGRGTGDRKKTIQVDAASMEADFNNWVGPHLDLPPEYRPMTVEAQIGDALSRLATYKKEFVMDLAAQYKVNLRDPQCLKMLAASHAQETEKRLSLHDDPRYVALQDKCQEMKDSGPEEAPHPRQSVSKANFKANFQESLQGLLFEISQVDSSRTMSKMLTETYHWFSKQVPYEAPDEEAALASAANRHKQKPPAEFHILLPEDLAADHTMPGSAFYGPAAATETDDLSGGESQVRTAGDKVAVPDDGVPPQPPLAQLPAPHERLRNFETKQVASPLNARRLAKLSELRSACASPDFVDRPFTPSTTAGGAFTARSSLPSTARSTPSPFPMTPSRPTSAASGYRRPMTANSMRQQAAGLPSRPGTATGFASSAIPEMPETTGRRRPAPIPGTEEKEPPTEAELRMEERWLHYRQKEITDQLVAEERRAVVRDWAERRARVEEEIARNIESSRYASELRRRTYRMPDDADDDIAPSVPAAAGAASAAPPATVISARAKSGAAEAPRFDVSKVEKGAVRFSWDGGVRAPSAARPKAAASARTAYLRRIHRKLLAAADDEERRGGAAEDVDERTDEDASSAAPADGKDERGAGLRISLSPYVADEENEGAGVNHTLRREDDSDVLASVCKPWWRAHNISPEDMKPAGVGMGLEELRFGQMQEVEDVKRVFARCNRPMDATVLERAMVMPVHRATGIGAVMRGSACHLPSNPFFKAPSKKKKKGKKGKAGGKKKKAK